METRVAGSIFLHRLHARLPAFDRSGNSRRAERAVVDELPTFDWELRGWDDGDAFMTSYVAHPFEGAIFGYIEQQNDPRYRNVMWGDGRKYWIARCGRWLFPPH